MTRYKASSLHFLGSAAILFIVFLAVRLVWYPGQLFFAASGLDLVKLIVSVDLVLGPLIMLIIFNPKKASLKFDIVCVLVCQVAFMMYGVWSIFLARPVYIAFVEDRFQLATANEIDTEDLKKATNPIFQALPLFGPMTIATKLPNDQKVQQEVLIGGLTGMGLRNLPQYFIPYADAMQTAKAAGKSVKNLKSVDDETRQQLLAFEQQQQSLGNNVLFLYLRTKQKTLFVVIDGATGAALRII